MILASGLTTPVPEQIVDGVRYDTLSLEPGWNQFSTPFAFPVLWGDRLPDTDIEDVIHEYISGEGYQALYRSDGSTLQPFKGYWAKNNADVAKTVSIPYRAVSASAPQQRLGISDDGGGWTVTLALHSGTASDITNVFRTRHDAEFGRDRYDFRKPPPKDIQRGNSLRPVSMRLEYKRAVECSACRIRWNPHFFPRYEDAGCFCEDQKTL